MRVLFVHPGPLLYTSVFLRLEPLGLELVAAAARQAGHECRLIDLQVESHKAYRRLVDEWQPRGDRLFLQLPRQCSGNRRPRQGHQDEPPAHLRLCRRPQCLVHRAGDPRSRRGRHRLRAQGRGRGRHRAAAGSGRRRPRQCSPRARRRHRRRRGPAAALRPQSRRIAARARPVASPAKIFHRHSRSLPPRSSSRAAVPGTARSAAPGPSTAAAIGWSARSGWSRTSPRSASPAPSSSTTSPSCTRSTASPSARRSRARACASNIIWRRAATCCCATRRFSGSGKRSGSPTSFSASKRSTRRDLAKYRKRISLGKNFEALEFARSLGVEVAINLIADPDWDEQRFAAVRNWCLEIPEIVNISVNTPYPGTESWLTEQRRLHDARLPAVRHSACGAADEAAARRVLSRTVAHPARALQQAPELAHDAGHCQRRGAPADARPDQFHPRHDALQQDLQCQEDAGRPCPAGALSDSAAAAALASASRSQRPRRRSSTCTRRATAAAAISTTRPRPSSRRPGWGPDRKSAHSSAR